MKASHVEYTVLITAVTCSSCWGQPQPLGKCGAFARRVSPGGGALVNLVEAEGRVLALLEHSLFLQREDL